MKNKDVISKPKQGFNENRNTLVKPMVKWLGKNREGANSQVNEEKRKLS
jgi:hypothetical protein